MTYPFKAWIRWNRMDGASNGNSIGVQNEMKSKKYSPHTFLTTTKQSREHATCFIISVVINDKKCTFERAIVSRVS